LLLLRVFGIRVKFAASHFKVFQMMSLAFVVAAYLLGSVSFAVVVSKVFALPDPRTYGSQNPGATNVLRTGRKLPAVLTLLGDALKGTVAVVLVQHFAPGNLRSAWRPSSDTCSRYSCASRVARVWRPPWACCWR
jgi:hypothetical protein